MKKAQYRLFRRRGVYYIQNNITGKQDSLGTKDRETAERLLAARNDAARNPSINFQIVQAYLAASDPEILTRTWQTVMDAAKETKKGPTLHRWEEAMRDKAFDQLRNWKLVETPPELFLQVLREGTVSFTRKKSKVEVLVRFGEKAATVLEQLPKSGPLFP